MYLRFDGVTMGGGRSSPLIVTDLTPPVVDKRGDSTDRLHGHGQTAPRQWLGGRSWAWTLATNGHSLREAFELAETIEQKWLDYRMMEDPVPVPLEYSNDGGATWFRVYGKPGRIASLKPDVRATRGVGILDLTFEQTLPAHYSNEVETVEISAVPASIGGLVAPLVAPLTTVASGAARAGRIESTGNLPAPVVVTFHGPSTNPRVETADGYVLGYRGTLAYDRSVTLDPLAETVRLDDGTDVPGRLTLSARLSSLSAPPGVSDWFYRSTDTSGTSRAVLAWRDAFTSMQYGGL